MNQKYDDTADVMLALFTIALAAAVITAFGYLILVDILSWPLAALGMSLRHNRWMSPGPFRMPLTSRALKAVGRRG